MLKHYHAMPASTIPANAFRKALLTWYQANARPLPWRQYNPPNPYHIWLAEIMLQQTTVAAVIPYYLGFLEAFPTVQSLAEADIQHVLGRWQGLGYYRRAHLLHACAQTVWEHHQGAFPTTEATLQTLPGIGPYTAAAVAALAFNQPTSVLDGNVERVMARLHRIATPLPAAKPILRTHAAALACPTNPCAYANAIMELGATVCTPTNPQCHQCPVNAFCQAFQHNDATHYPVKSPKKAVPTLTAHTYVITDPTGAVYLHKRGASGMLANLWETPTLCQTQPNRLGWPTTLPMPLPNPPNKPTRSIQHVFTHLKLTVQVYELQTTTPHPTGHGFPRHTLPPLSNLMRKVLQA